MNILDSYTKEEATAYLLKALGIQPHLMGWKYINYAVNAAIDEPSLLDHITKGLYPTVAQEFGTTSNRVERAIRHAIETAYRCSSADSWVYTIFSSVSDVERGKPTNALFVATCAEMLTLELHHPIFIIKEAAV